MVVLVYLLFGSDKSDRIEQTKPSELEEHGLVSSISSTRDDIKNIVGIGKIKSTSPVLSEPSDYEYKISNTEKVGSDSSSDPDIQQDELTEEMLSEIEKDIGDKKLDLGDIGGIAPDGIEKLRNSNIQDTISINELPDEIASEARRDVDFRKKNGYDKASQREADEILSAIGQISGSDKKIPDLQFNVSLLPSIITDNYQYIGYIYPYQSENPVTYSSVKRVFSHYVDSGILVIKEDDLRNGSATLTTEFVNAKIGGCPAMIIEKRDDIGRKYGQINWNTRQIGYTIYQFNKQNSVSSLLELANAIYIKNQSLTNCEPQGSNKGEFPVENL